ncbi:hypothetical protein ACFSGI_00330 [Paenibacillus nicotianae]|uniref:Uncharacterized protein n=1 Tax=Paenibacillus nicotianae TaxID=1526551 RepID=A0ABW4ULM8_9BACL
MSIIRLFALRNLLIVACAIAAGLAVYKGIQISQKIEAVQEADRYYAQKQWVEAETFYQQANTNTSIQYQNEHIANRLLQLLPITDWKQTVSSSQQQLQSAASTQQFEAYLTAYKLWQQRLSQQQKADKRYAVQYKQITNESKINEQLKTDFQAFRELFEAGLQNNLQKRNYTDESDKWNLLLIPEKYLAVKGTRQAYLNTLFKTYDQTKLTRLAAAGDFTAFLEQARTTWEGYQQHDWSATWVLTAAQNNAAQTLAKDIANQQISNFVTHAQSFNQWVTSVNLSSSPVTTTINNEINSLLLEANNMVTAGQYQQALDIYQALQPVQDTTTLVAQTKVAWASSDPLYVLQSSNPSVTYQHVVGGTNGLNADVYALATDTANHLYIGRMTANGDTSILSGEIAQQAAQIRSLAIVNTLGTPDQPVIEIQSEPSTDRTATFSFYAVENSGFRALLSVEADGYTIGDNQTIQVQNPSDLAKGQTAIYTRNQDGDYTRTETQNEYTSIDGSTLTSYLNQPVSFEVNIVSTDSDNQGAIALVGEQYIRLRGELNWNTGSFVVSGVFRGEFEPFTSTLGSGNTDSTDGNSTPTEENGTTESTDETGLLQEPDYGLEAPDAPANLESNVTIPVFEVESLQ